MSGNGIEAARTREDGEDMETTLAKGLKMLEALARSEGPRGVSELGRELGVTRSNAHAARLAKEASGG